METIKNADFINALLPLAIIIFIIAIGVVLLNQHFQKNLSLQKLEQKVLKSNYQNELLRSSIHVQEEERKRIAHDIHDELGAVLSIIRMHLLMLEQQSTGNAAHLLAGLQNVRQLSETVLASIRSISHQLMPPQLETFGLIKTLESVIEPINQPGNIYIRLTSLPGMPDLPWLTSLDLYRIIMELINNTIKHARASEVHIDITYTEPYIVCTYTDNGIGLPENAINKGLGHKSIEGRVSVLEGTLEWGNQKEAGGFYAIIQIPVGL